MKLNLLIFIIINLIYFNVEKSFAQTLEFNVVRPKVKIETTPKYDYLYQHIAHPIIITVSDENRKFRFELAGGEINQTDSGMFLVPQANDIAVLNIYEQRKGNEELVFSLKYNVLKEPKAYLRNKPTDMALSDVLLLSGKLEAASKNKNEAIKLEVLSFTVIYKDIDKDAFKSVVVIGNSIPVATRKDMAKLPNGSMIYYENIKVKLNENITTLIAPYRVTMELTEGKGVTDFGIGN